MKKDFLLNAATVVLAACALVVTGLVVRRELFLTPEAQARPRNVAEWRGYAAEGQRVGPADAPVVITEFSDFQCPFCRLLAERLDTLQARRPGQVAVVFRHFPLPTHQHAGTAAKASECAAEQGRFKAYHDALFARQDSIGRISWTRFAALAEVPDTAVFAACLARPGNVPAMVRDAKAGHELEVTGTPTFLVNGVRMQGVPPMDSLEAYVDRALGRTTRVEIEAR